MPSYTGIPRETVDVLLSDFLKKKKKIKIKGKQEGVRLLINKLKAMS